MQAASTSICRGNCLAGVLLYIVPGAHATMHRHRACNAWPLQEVLRAAVPREVRMLVLQFCAIAAPFRYCEMSICVRELCAGGQISSPDAAVGAGAVQVCNNAVAIRFSARSARLMLVAALCEARSARPLESVIGVLLTTSFPVDDDRNRTTNASGTESTTSCPCFRGRNLLRMRDLEHFGRSAARSQILSQKKHLKV